MASAGAERRPGPQEGSAEGPAQLVEATSGCSQSSEMTVRPSSLQTLGRGALAGQSVRRPSNCQDKLHRRAGAWAGALHPHLVFNVGCLMTDTCILCPAMVTSYLYVTSSVQ